MTSNLPAYLQKAQLSRLADRATDGIGSSLPPHISIRANEFTLIDATGAEKSIETKYLDVVILDMADVMGKLYYGKDYVEDSRDPPLCFSANGIGPSKEAQQPQAPTCAQCPHNIRGSAVSKLSGVAIKACRDEKWVAVATAQTGGMVFQLRITPGSFVNWKAYIERFKNQPFDIRDVVTRLQFEAKKNGVLVFTPQAFIDEATTALRKKLLDDKTTDVFVGRNDRPIAALPAPGQAIGQSETLSPVGLQQPSQEPSKGRGRPKKTAEPAPANAPAPFRPENPPGQPAANAAPFGFGNPAAPPSGIEQELDNFFGSGGSQ